MDQLFSVAAACIWLGGVSRWTVYAWLSQGRIKRTKVGRRVMIAESELKKFIADRPSGSDDSKGDVR